MRVNDQKVSCLASWLFCGWGYISAGEGQNNVFVESHLPQPEVVSGFFICSVKEFSTLDLSLTLGRPHFCFIFACLSQNRWLNEIGQKKASSLAITRDTQAVMVAERRAEVRQTCSIFGPLGHWENLSSTSDEAELVTQPFLKIHAQWRQALYLDTVCLLHTEKQDKKKGKDGALIAAWKGDKLIERQQKIYRLFTTVTE